MVTKPAPAVKLPLCRRIKAGGEGAFHILQVLVVRLGNWILAGIKSNMHLASPRQKKYWFVRNISDMFAHAHTHTHTIYTCIHIYVNASMHACIHTYMHTYIHTYIHTYVHTYIHTYIYIHIHTHIHTYMHTYIRTPVNIQYTHTHKYVCDFS